MINADIDRDAPVIVRLERRLCASRVKLWSIHTSINAWPQWQRDIVSATLDEPFRPGASFTWKSHGLAEPIISAIYAVVPEIETVWGGPSSDITGIHRWHFEGSGDGTHVITEESWAGASLESDAAKAKAKISLEASLERWLDALAQAAQR